jgi:hypothetical protein
LLDIPDEGDTMTSNPIRGLVFGLLLSAPMWAVIIMLFWVVG